MNQPWVRGAFILITIVSRGAVHAADERKPVAAKCDERVLGPETSPLAAFYAELERLRVGGRDGRRDLDKFVHESEYLAGIAASAQHTVVEDLIGSRLARKTSREIIDAVLKSYARAHASGTLAEPMYHSVAEVETHFDPTRVVDLTLAPELVEDVISGRKTSSIRKDNRWEVKSGPGRFVVTKSSVTVPIRITSVRFRRTFTLFTEDDLRAQGPLVAKILDEEGKAAALRHVRQELRQIYPDATLGDDFTVIHYAVVRQ